jgi:hypothetical protein
VKAIMKRTPGVDDYDRHGNLKEPERFGLPPYTKYAEMQPTKNGTVMRTDGTDGYDVDTRHFRGDGDCVWVYITNEAKGISTAEKMPQSQVQAYVRRVTGRR